MRLEATARDFNENCVVLLYVMIKFFALWLGTEFALQRSWEVGNKNNAHAVKIKHS
jgi:hypothetical protein